MAEPDWFIPDYAPKALRREIPLNRSRHLISFAIIALASLPVSCSHKCRFSRDCAVETCVPASSNEGSSVTIDISELVRPVREDVLLRRAEESRLRRQKFESTYFIFHRGNGETGYFGLRLPIQTSGDVVRGVKADLRVRGLTASLSLAAENCLEVRGDRPSVEAVRRYVTSEVEHRTLFESATPAADVLSAFQ